ncbi:nuclear pore complex protein Nup214 [Protopterus annectens]|uniref:nuclear pore complex protein Nup214 n=1 Tax=Protopterus annectens TaxID=7888 RepID=UPI001CFA33B5|nr:nuclear pore complex protein Nup214 [Protopterus annectens]
MGDDPDAVPEREMKDFQFKQMKKIRVFDSPDELPKERSSLLAVSNTYGLTIVGSPGGLKIFQTKDIVAANQIGGDPNEIIESVSSLPVALKLPVHHMALASDDLTLSACMASSEHGVFVYFFDIRVFNKNKQQKSPFAYQKLSMNASCLVIDLKWNPAIPSMLAACLSDGSISVMEVTDTVKVIATLPYTAGITSVCWSPKGKQLAAGRLNGTVVQYLQTLQEKKVIPCPPFFDSDNPVKVLDVLWLSTYVFAIAYAAADGSLETPPEVVIVSLPKKEDRQEEIFLNFNDLCFGICNERQHHYFLNHIEFWDIILAASAASTEVSIIARQEDKSNWEIWLLEDSSRAELPVTDNNDDTLPLGLAVDYTSQTEIYISDEKTLPPAPILMLLSTDGVLCPFYLINSNPGAKSLVRPAQNLPSDGERLPKAGFASPPSSTASTVPKSETSVMATFTAAAASNLLSPSSQAPAASGALSSFSFAAASVKPLPTSASSSSSFSFAPPAHQTVLTNSFTAPSSFSFASPSLSGPSAALVGSPGLKPFLEASGPPATVNASLNMKTSLTQGPVISAAKQKSSEKSKAVDIPATSGSLKSAPSSSAMFAFTSTPKPPTGGPFNQPPALGVSSVASSKTSVASPAAVNTRPPQNMSAALPPQKPSKMSVPATRQGITQPTVSSSASEIHLSESDPVMAGIKEEIAHFQKELEELKSRTAVASFTVGTTEETKILRKEADELHTFLLEIKETTESVHGDIGTLKTTLLEGFAGVEEARTRSERNCDPGYLKLLHKKPLDPKSEAQLKNICHLYQYVKCTSQDVNEMLDIEWERYLDSKKQQKRLIAPEREILFHTLANNKEIINQQRQRLDKLVKNLHHLRLYNQTSQWSMPSDSAVDGIQSFDGELEGLHTALMKTTLEASPISSPRSPGGKLSPVKQAQLRSFLSKRKTPTERSTAPANLSRSAFLSPEYYESLNEDSSSSSVSQALEDDVQLAEQEDVSINIPRHAPVVRTPSIQPGMITPGPALGKVQLGFGGLNAGTSGKITLDGADSTALVTKTVKHGAPANEKPPQSTLPAAQAAAAAALRRQMASQSTVTSTSLTESTLKNVPQVKNALEIKDSNPQLSVSPVIGPSVPASAAQVVRKVLDTVATNQTNQVTKSSFGKTQSTVKPPATAPAMSAVQWFSFGNSGQGAGRTDTTSFASALSSTVTPASLVTKPSLFSSPGFGPLTTTSTSVPIPVLSGVQVNSASKDSSQSNSFVFGSSTKPAFSPATESSNSFGTLKPASAITTSQLTHPSPEALVSSSRSSVLTTASSSSAAADSTTTTKSEVQLGKLGDGFFQTTSAGETLGSFSGLRVGQTDDATKTTSKASSSVFNFAQLAKSSAVTPGFAFGSSLQLGKPSDAKPVLSTAAALITSTTAGSDDKSSSNLQMANAKPQEVPSSAAKPSFVFGLPQTGNSVTPPPALSSASPLTTTSSFEPVSSFGSASSVPAADSVISNSSGDAKLQAPVQKPVESTLSLQPPQQAPDSATNSSLSKAENVTDMHSGAATSPPTTEVTSLPPLSTSKTEPVSLLPTSALPNTVISATSVDTSSAISSTVVSANTPASTAESGGSASTAASSGSLFGIASLSPAAASPFGQPDNSTGQSTVFSQTLPSTSTATTTTSTITGSTFGLQVTTAASTAFGQPATSTASSTAGSAFSAPVSTAESAGGFGKLPFGQAPSFGLTANSTSGFGQPVFGMQPAFGQGSPSTPASTSESMFGGSSAASTSSSFSFGASTASSGGPIFGQCSAPVFGQTSAFGQTGSLFGSNTTTTPSSGFSFGQPSGFGGNTTGSLFGQTSTGGNSVFDQTTTSSSLFGNSGAKSFGFGSTTFGEQKPSGTFSSGSGSVAIQGFGSFSTATKAGGFGAAPVFGSPPTFGGTPSFGGTQTFGSAPSFSNNLGPIGGKVFGEGTAAANTGGFGFGGSGNAVSFGALAGQTSQTPPAFGALPQQTSTFGGQTGGFSNFGSSGSGGFGFASSSQSSQQGFSGWRG